MWEAYGRGLKKWGRSIRVRGGEGPENPTGRGRSEGEGSFSERTWDAQLLSAQSVGSRARPSLEEGGVLEESLGDSEGSLTAGECCQPAAGRVHTGGRSLAPLTQAGSISQDTAVRDTPPPRLSCSSLSDLIHILFFHVASLPESTPAATQAHFHGPTFVTVHPQVPRMVSTTLSEKPVEEPSSQPTPTRNSQPPYAN